MSPCRVTVLNNTSKTLFYKNVGDKEEFNISLKDPRSTEPNNYIPYKNPIHQVIPDEGDYIEVTFGGLVKRSYHNQGKLWTSFLADSKPAPPWVSNCVCFLNSGEYYEFVFSEQDNKVTLEVKNLSAKSENIGGKVMNVALQVLGTVSTLILGIIL